MRPSLLLAITLSALGVSCAAHQPLEPPLPAVLKPPSAVFLAADVLDGAADANGIAALVATVEEHAEACVVTTILSQALPSVAEGLRAGGRSIPEIVVSIEPCWPLLGALEPPINEKTQAVFLASSWVAARGLSRVARYVDAADCTAAVAIEAAARYLDEDLSAGVLAVLADPSVDLVVAGRDIDFKRCDEAE